MGKVSEAELVAAGIPHNFRDYCSHIVIPLFECRATTYNLPWRCHDLFHAWEVCEHNDYIRRKRRVALNFANKNKVLEEAGIWPLSKTGGVPPPGYKPPS